MIHSNSAASFASESDSGRLGKRAQAIMETMQEHEEADMHELSDREVMTSLNFTDPNKVRPRITELIKCGKLEECGSMRDPATNKRVRLVRLRQGQQRLF